MIKRINPIRARSMRRLSWHDPAKILVNLRYIELRLSPDLDDKVRRLRTNTLKDWREARDAALFAYGLGRRVLQQPVLVAKSEEMDYDCIIRWQKDRGDYFYPVQLKELPPADLNPDVTLDDMYAKVEQYNGQSDLSIAINVNRATTLEYRPWSRQTRPPINELWLFGCLSADHSRWFIYGNVLHRAPRFLEFDYPHGNAPVV